ncbi:MAG: flippase-like domain-containing protein [Myxococcales bacterium]|nr:flippase-like domain-containing protein [Myxococcales bacterium]
MHLRSGDVVIDAAQCARLRCEPGLLSTLGSARPGVLAALLVVYGAGTLAWAARWRALLGFAGIDLPLRELWRVSIEAQAGGILLPGGIGGDALRIASVAGRAARPGAARAPLVIVVASVLLDRAVGLSVIAGTAAATAALAGALGPDPALGLPPAGAAAAAPASFARGALPAPAPAEGLLAALAAVPFAFVVAVAALRASSWPRGGWATKGRVGRFVTPVLAYVRHPDAPRALAIAAALSVLVAGTQFATIRGLVHALGASPAAGGERWVYLGTAMAFVVSAIPALPGGWGTADATYVFFFAFSGLTPTVALSVCLFYRLFWYLSGIAGVILQFLHPGRPRGAPAPAAAGTAGREGARKPPE